MIVLVWGAELIVAPPLCNEHLLKIVPDKDLINSWAQTWLHFHFHPIHFHVLLISSECSPDTHPSLPVIDLSFFCPVLITFIFLALNYRLLRLFPPSRSPLHPLQHSFFILPSLCPTPSPTSMDWLLVPNLVFWRSQHRTWPPRSYSPQRLLADS